MSKRRSAKKFSRKVDEDVMAELVPNCCCFICDEVVKSNGVQIVLGRTPYSNVGLPAKIGQLIGDSFMVVVGVSDTMCARCASLICHLDKLETDARSVKKTLMGYIAAKYQLDHKEICARIDDSEVGCESHQLEEKQKSPSNISLGQTQHDTLKTSHNISLLTSNVKSSKVNVFNCENCSFFTTDKDALQIHSALCMKQVNQCSQCGQLCNSSDQLYLFTGTCKVCSLSFDSEEEYSKHMTIHVINFEKCAACGITCSDRDNLVTHILNHGLQTFNCAECPATFNLKTELYEHMESHRTHDKCLKCSVDFVSQTKPLSDGEFSLTCLNETGQANDAPEQSKVKNVNDYMESLMGLDGFDSDSNIEFHPCPSCGLTFLNKVLFSEHMKMHNENQDQVDMNEAHEEVLKSAAVSVAGDCSIDDDLEDLFEKLHAETTSSSLVSDQGRIDKSDCLSHQIIDSKNESDVDFSVSLKDEDLRLCVAPSTVSCIEVPQILPKLAETTSENDKNIDDQLPKNSLESVSLSSFDASLVEKERSCMTVEPSSDIFDSVQHQTFIYISNNANGLSDCDAQGNLILHNATIDPESGNIRLLPFDPTPPPQLHSPLLENDGTNCAETQGFEQNFQRMQPEPEPAVNENKLKTDNIVERDALSCSFCGFQTSIELVLKRHLKIHQDNLVQKCSICNSVFSSIQRLLSHFDSRHKNAGPITCPFCSEVFDDSLLLKEHFGKKHPVGKHNFLCRFCPKKFSTRKMCISHEESHSEIFKYECELCLKKFTLQEDLDDHIKWDHDRVGQCRYCGKHIDKPKALKNHELRHMQESNHHECVECKRVFKTKTGLRHHAASHTGQFKFCCDFCGRGFMSRMMLEEHRSCHTKEERYICDVCGQKFTFQSTYWIHRKWHETPYPYKCSYCGRFFKHSSLLAVHKRKHTGERPYKCPHCPLTFPVSGTLKRHIILHTGVYPFNCDACKRGFTARHKYASHLEKVHGIQDLASQKLVSNELNVSPPNVIDNDIPENVKEWELDDITLEEQSLQALSMVEPIVTNRDPLISDQNIPSRVVEIVLDGSYQAVATVTLGSGESLIPDNWYG